MSNLRQAPNNTTHGPLWHALIAPLLPTLLACFKVFNRDIGYHVATGRAVDLGGVPVTNILSFTNPETPWILHQWIPAWIFHRIDQWLGPSGLVTLKLAVIYTTFAVLWIAIRKRCQSGYTTFFWFVIAAAAAAPRYYVRPFIFSMLCLSVLLWALTLRRHHWRKFLWVTSLAIAVCSACHAGFVYLLIVAGATMAAAVVTQDRPLAHIGWFIGLLCVAAMTLQLVNPHGWRVLLLPFQFSVDPYYHEHLIEFRPPELDLRNFPSLWIGLLGAAIAIGVSAHQRFQNKTWRCAEWLTAVGCLIFFGWLALRHARIVFAWSLVTAFFAGHLTDEILTGLKESKHRLTGMLLATLAVIIGGHSIGLWLKYSDPGFGRDNNQYPAQLMDFIKDQSLPDPAYVSDAWGGYWLWTFYPDRRVFYDNRLEAYPSGFFKDVYQSIRYGEAGWEDKLEHYGIKLAVLRYSTPGERRFLEGRPGIRRLMLASPDWQLTYWDDLGMIFVRADSVPEQCKRCSHAVHFDPDTNVPLIDDHTSVTAELKQILRNSGPSARLYAALARSAIWAGNVPEAAGYLKEGLRRYPSHPILSLISQRLVSASQPTKPLSPEE